VAIQIGQVALLGGVCPLLLRALASFGGAHDVLSAGDHTRVETSLLDVVALVHGDIGRVRDLVSRERSAIADVRDRGLIGNGRWLAGGDKTIPRNRARDARVDAQLVELGWEVLRLWDCEVEKDAAGCAARVAAALERCRARS